MIISDFNTDSFVYCMKNPFNFVLFWNSWKYRINMFQNTN